MSTAETIYVYVLDGDPSPPRSLPSEWVEHLDRADRLRLQAMTSPKRRAEFVLGRLLAGYALRRAAGGAWRLVAAEGRPPRLAGDPGASLPSISLSHSAGLVACALAPMVRLGVDVERCRERRSGLRALAKLALHPSEQAELALLDEPAGLRRFYELWTLKEALAKALGQGIDLGFENFAFQGRQLVAEPNVWRGAGCAWHFDTRPVGKDGVLALAWEAPRTGDLPRAVLHPVELPDLL